VSRGQSEGGKIENWGKSVRILNQLAQRLHPLTSARALLGASQMAVRLQPD
jgi:hypothetical protein